MVKKQQKISVKGIEIVTFKKNEKDYISLTDIARYKDQDRSDYILQNWMRTRTAIEFLGLWEKLNNPNFNSIEFDGFRKESGLRQGLPQPKRLIQLNQIAITQLKSLLGSSGVKKLEG